MGCGRGLSFANVSTAKLGSDTEVSPIHRQVGVDGKGELDTYQKSQGFLSEWKNSRSIHSYRQAGMGEKGELGTYRKRQGFSPTEKTTTVDLYIAIDKQGWVKRVNSAYTRKASVVFHPGWKNSTRKTTQ